MPQLRMMGNFLNQLLNPSMEERASEELRLRRNSFSGFKATSVNKADFSSQNDCEGKFATILKEIMNAEKSDSRPWIVSGLIPIPLDADSARSLPISEVEYEDGFTSVNSPPQEKFPDLPLSFRLSSLERLGLSSLRIETTYRNQAKGQENQLYQQQILLMPLLQFPMPKMANDPNIIQSEAETFVVLESSGSIGASDAGNFISENQFTAVGELGIKRISPDFEFRSPEFCQVVSQDFYEPGISPEKLNDVSLALGLQNTEKSLVISGKTKSSVAFCIAGVDSKKTRQLFFSAAPILHNQLKQLFTYKSLDKIENHLPQSKPLSKRTEPNSKGVNANLSSLGNDRLSFLIRARAFPHSIGGQGGEGFPPAQQAKQSASIIQNEQPGLLSDVSPADIINQIGHKMQITFREPLDLKTGLEELRVQLKPEHLGPVTLKASMTEGLLAVDINTASVAVKNIIESHLHDLRQTLSQQGIEVGQFNVSAEANMSGFGSQWEMFSPREQDVRDNKHNTRLLVDEAWQQESWLARRTLIDLWM
ncbi:MAG: flagellar hook-length control protein FliK [Candidatus Poribacteria bacterium]